MNQVCRDIFKAVHEGKWMSIEYKNKEEKTTRYWIGIKDIDMRRRTLSVEGLHLSMFRVETYSTIFIDSILSSSVIEGSYYAVPQKLIKDIYEDPVKYRSIFQHAANLKILNYLADCNRLDTTPYKAEYALIRGLDENRFKQDLYQLSDSQFSEVVAHFQHKATEAKKVKTIKQIAINVMSINTRSGLYVLAYRKLRLDVKQQCLRPEKEVTICREFTVNGQKQSIRKFLDEEDLVLLENFMGNLEEIKDRITRSNRHVQGVDDMPYLIAVGSDVMLDLEHEYSAIMNMYESGKITEPVRAFFGDLTKRKRNKKGCPLALLNRKVNIDQLLAIHNAFKASLTYVQGPPGTGKTNTILNSIVTAFFNEKTVLFASYNNHPIDSVFESLKDIVYKKGSRVPFPVIRLGNNEKMAEATVYIREMYERTQEIKIFNSTLNKNKDDKIERTKQLSELLKKHEEILDLRERKETIEKLLRSNAHMNFQVEVQGRQLHEVKKRLSALGEVRDEQVLALLDGDMDEFIKYLYYTSAKYIKRLGEPKNKELLDIVYIEEEEERVTAFNQYLRKEENLKKLLRIFPIVATTCISAHKLAEPKPYFDMVIIDEASQCNTAISLIPIIRGNTLMLVGDPQQLNPVIMLDPKDNIKLMQMYSIQNEYNYITNSIYKTYLSCDSISEEILLSYHYRCHRKIIEFNNRKYYNNKLNIKTDLDTEEPLVFIDILNNCTSVRNTSPAEAGKIVEYIADHRGKKIGVITPFTKQKEYIMECLKRSGIEDVVCGTVHAFQGDEKDIILFSLALTDQTQRRTYHWLKNNKELINVATSRAKERLVILSSHKNLERLHQDSLDDDLYELVQYTKTNGSSEITEKTAGSRALGIKPYSTATEEAFLKNLNHALDNILNDEQKCEIKKEVAISQVFQENFTHNDLFYTGRFDFVIYEREPGGQLYPVFAIELDGKEHVEDDIVRARDRKKNEICRQHGFELLRVENSYARRYYYMKEILIKYFEKAR